MDNTYQAVLLIADISGYTRFMRLHALATSHARQIIARLLRALIDASRPPLQLHRLEGDAVFFYALAADEAELPVVAERVRDQIPRLLRAFHREITALAQVKLCVCEACVRVRELKLKQVAHAGEVAFESIHRERELFGIDVVVAHRLLKNSVPADEYVLLTRAVYASIRDFYGQEPAWHREELEGVGEVEAAVFYSPQLEAALVRLTDEPAAPSRADLVRWKLRMHLRTLRELLAPRARSPAPIPVAALSRESGWTARGRPGRRAGRAAAARAVR